MLNATGSVSPTGATGTQRPRGRGAHVVDIQVNTNVDTSCAAIPEEVRAGQNPAVL